MSKQDNKATIKQITDYIDQATKAMADKSPEKEHFQKIVGYIKNGVDHAADNAEKWAYLIDAAARYANQMTFLMFRQNILTDELEATYRALPSVDDTTESYRVFVTEHDKEFEEIQKLQRAFEDKQKGMEIYKAIVGGMPKEAAQKQLEEYEKQKKAALGGQSGEPSQE